VGADLAGEERAPRESEPEQPLPATRFVLQSAACFLHLPACGKGLGVIQCQRRAWTFAQPCVQFWISTGEGWRLLASLSGVNCRPGLNFGAILIDGFFASTRLKLRHCGR